MSVAPQQEWYNELVLAIDAQHAGRVDLIGRPWAEHFQRVALRLYFRNPEASRDQLEAALVHDVMMPRGGGEEFLAKHGITAEAIELIRLITPPANADYFRDFKAVTARDNEAYIAYIERLCRSRRRDAIEVKLADICDTIDQIAQSRSPAILAHIPERYGPCRTLMEQALVAT